MLLNSGGYRIGKGVFNSNPKEGQCQRIFKLPITLISHAKKIILKILQDRLQQHVNRELPDVQAGFRKARETRDKIANVCCIIEKAREFQGKQTNKKKLPLLHRLH